MSGTANGTAALRRASTSASTARAASADPLQGVLDLGPRLPVGVMLFAAFLAVSMHAGAAVGAVQAAVLHAFGAWARDVKGAVSDRLAQTYDIDLPKPVEKAVEPPPPPPPEEKEPPKLVKELPKDEPPPPPPAAADAAKVLLAAPAKDEPVDLTGNTFLNGNADTAVGGATQIGGSSKVATSNTAAVATGVPGGTGTAGPASPKVDRSRAAQIVNKANLERCPFPPEADAEQVDEAAVGIEVKVSVEGRAEAVTVTRDPGHGFGREARKCALRESYAPALNVEGTAIPGVYRVLFRFNR
jgi:protein TonB